MMKKQTAVPKWVSVLLMILLVLATASILMNIVAGIKNHADSSTLASYILDLLTCLCAFLYGMSGYKKEGMVPFRVYCLLFSIAWVSTILARAPMGIELYLITAVLSYGAVSALTTGKDFGRQKSYRLAGVVMGCTILDFMIMFQNINKEIAFALAGKLMMALVLCIMVYGKYQDKECRHAK